MANNEIQLTSEDRKMLEAIHEKVIKIEVVLLGADGDEGLVSEVQDLKRKYNRLTLGIYTLIGILIGLGLLTSGALGLL